MLVGEKRDAREPRNGRRDRTAASGDHRAVEAEALSVHLHSVRADEAAVAKIHIDAERGQSAGGIVRADGCAPFAHALHDCSEVGLDRCDTHTERRCTFHLADGAR